MVCSTVPEIAGNPDIAAVGKPQDLAVVYFAIVRASFGAAETGSVLLGDVDLRVNPVVYLAQHLIVLLDRADIVVNLHHAYRRPEFRKRHYARFTPAPRHRGNRGCVDPRRPRRTVALCASDCTVRCQLMKSEQSQCARFAPALGLIGLEKLSGIERSALNHALAKPWPSGCQQDDAGPHN